MAYVEYLRARRVLVGTGIVLLIGFLFSGISRLALQGTMQMNMSGGVHQEGMSNVEPAGFFFLSLITGLVVATILGSPLAKENSGHLEIDWTKPVSREALALRIFGVDIAAILISQFMTVIFEIISLAVFTIGLPTNTHVTYDPASLWFVLVALLGPLAWYGLLNGITASMKQGAGVALGLTWPAAIFVVFLSQIQNPKYPLVQLFHAVMVFLKALDPLAYLGMTSSGNELTLRSSLPPAGIACILAAMTVVYCAAAIVQWRRVEA